MTNFASLKKTSSDISRLTKEIEKINNPESSSEYEEDTRFWKLTRGKDGNGSAVIRFLPGPAVDGDDALPWVRYFDHWFKGPTGKWYVENSLTTFGKKDPVSEFNSTLWGDSSIKDESYRPIERKQARDQKRRLHYVSNIYVVSDPANRENEGKVFLFKYGKKIFDKVTLAMKPEDDSDESFVPFDLWKGANLKLRCRTVAGYPNYDQSLWSAVTALSDDDAELEKIWKSEYSLKEFIDPKNYKSYDELKKRLGDVLMLNDQITDSVTTSRQSSVETSKPTFDGPKTKKYDDASLDEDEDYFKNLIDN